MRRFRGLMIMVLAVALLVAGLNLLADPYGVFGLNRWTGFAMTLAPENAKALWVDRHPGDYDSFVIGSAAAAIYAPEDLNDAFGGSFYNLSHEYPDPEYDASLVRWLLRRRNVRHILLVLDPRDCVTAPATEHIYYKVSGKSAAGYYLRYLLADPARALDRLRRQDDGLPQPWDQWIPETGLPDRRREDSEPISSLEAYLSAHDFSSPGVRPMDRLDRCAELLGEIRDLCRQSGTELTVIASPLSKAALDSYAPEELDRWLSAMAGETELWCFTGDCLDPRYFYDRDHPRQAVGAMVLSRITDGHSYVPEEFGHPIRQGAAASLQRKRIEVPCTALPVLLYHDLAEQEETDGTVLPPSLLDHQLALLQQQGYEAVTLAEVAAYVASGVPLPEHPLLITFDDGYTSNYEYGYPLLQKYNTPAAIFVIGCSVGHSTYKDTDQPITPHFGPAEIQEMTGSGLVTIGSHTYDMHQWPPYETGDRVRPNILPLEGETDGDYYAALRADALAQQDLFDSLGLDTCRALAFPAGQRVALTNLALRDLGYQFTFTTDEFRVNCLLPGLPQTLLDLGRLTVNGSTTTDEALLDYLTMGD